jgi:hypothetical protein
MVRLSILADENLRRSSRGPLDHSTPDTHSCASRTSQRPLVDELCNLDSDLNSTTVSNDTVGPIIIDNLDPSVAGRIIRHLGSGIS